MPIGFNLAGIEFTANTYTTQNQNYSDVAALAGGGYVVTWESEQQDGSTAGIFSQRFSAKGKALGAEKQVNTYTENGQSSPAVAGLKNGRYVIVWQSSSPLDSPDFDPVYGQMYSAKGKPIGGEFRVNTTTPNWQNDADVTALADGGFVVTWTSLGSGSFERTDIFAQRYDASGTKVGGEMAVNSTVYSTQHQSSTTALANGGFVVTWGSYGQDGNGYGVIGRIFKANGDPKGDEFVVNTYTDRDQETAQIAALPGGGFVVTWVSYGPDGSNKGVVAKLFNAKGIAQGAEFVVNTYNTANQTEPAIASFADGGFVIVWSSANQDGTPFSVFGQRFDAKGNPIGDEVPINETPGNFQYLPTVTTLKDGSFVVSYSSSTPNVTDGVDVVVHRYQAQTFGTGGKDTLRGNKKGNLIDGLDGNDKIFGRGGADELSGSKGNDVLVGGAGKDLLLGGKGADVLRGGGGNDRLVGGAGKDKMTGNAGADKFIFKFASDSSVSSPDRITDFETGVDEIQLAKVFAGDLSFIGTAAFSGTASEVRLTETSGDTLVSVDVDGDGSADMAIKVLGVTGLTVDDFLL